MGGELHLLCAGAVQGLVQALQAEFESATGTLLRARFGAVGALREALLGGAPCDLIIVTEAMLRDLRAEGRLAAAALTPIGRVRTGVAVRTGAARPAIGSRADLKAALSAAPALYFPDPERATAGKHVASVLERLGLRAATTGRVRNFPNGAASMRALADEGIAGAIGCTQASEILATEGVDLLGVFEGEFELSTTYAAGLAAGAAAPGAALRLIDLLAGPANLAARQRCGIEPPLPPAGPADAA